MQLSFTDVIPFQVLVFCSDRYCILLVRVDVTLELFSVCRQAKRCNGVLWGGHQYWPHRPYSSRRFDEVLS